MLTTLAHHVPGGRTALLPSLLASGCTSEAVTSTTITFGSLACSTEVGVLLAELYVPPGTTCEGCFLGESCEVRDSCRTFLDPKKVENAADLAALASGMRFIDVDLGRPICVRALFFGVAPQGCQVRGTLEPSLCGYTISPVDLSREGKVELRMLCRPDGTQPSTPWGSCLGALLPPAPGSDGGPGTDANADRSGP